MDNSFEAKPRNMHNVQVVVRCRPTSVEERARGVHETVHCDTMGNEVRVNVNKQLDKSFSFDRVYDSRATQQEIYLESVEPLVHQTLRGYNTTILAYGQTGTGKTHTMEGDIESRENMGVIPRVLETIFRTLENKGDTESYVKASYLEIYNENLTDLLSYAPTNFNDPAPSQQQLRIVEDKTKPGKGVYVHNLEEVLVKSQEDIRKVMKLAMSRRKVAATELNERSSRSHAVFTLTIHSKEFSPEGEEMMRVGKINLVDLAGSECIGRSGSKDARAREAGNINQSLLTLGRVITALVEKSPYIAYRDSKLTRLLQESLGGCSLTLMIATVAPSVQCLDETISTLEYASRAKAIKNKPMINHKVSKRVAIKEYVEEIERLRMELQCARAKDGVYLPEDEHQKLVNNNKTSALRIQDLEASLEKRAAEFSDIRATLAQTSTDLKMTRQELDNERDRLSRTKEQLKKKENDLEIEKRSNEERQAIIDAHVNTESRLHVIHDELQERLKSAKDQIRGLHDKIDRKSAVEKENEQVASETRQVVSKNLVEITELVRDGRVVSNDGSMKVIEQLDRLSKLICEDFKQSQDLQRERFLNACQSNSQKTLENVSKLIQTSRSRALKESDMNTESFQELADILQEILRAHNDVIYMANTSHENENTVLRTKCLTPLIEEIERSKTSSANFFHSISSLIESVKEAIFQLVADYELHLGYVQEEFEEVLEQEKGKTKNSLTGIKAKIEMLFEDFSQDQGNNFDQMASEMRMKHEIISTYGQHRADLIADCFDMLQQGNENFVTFETNSKLQSVKDARKVDSEITEISKNETEGVLERSNEAINNIQSGISEAVAAKMRVAESLEEQLQEMGENLNGFIAETQSHQNLYNELSSNAIEEESKMKERSLGFLSHSRKEVENIRTNTDSFCDKSLSQLEVTRNQVDDFHLKADRPTCRTPSKLQVLDWTRERPQTSPHAKIIHRVKESHRQRTAVKPGKSLFDIEDSSSILNRSSSTMSVQSNSESVLMSDRKAGETGLFERDANIDGNELETMKVTELRAALKDRGLSCTGNKQIMKERLRRFSIGENAPIE